MAKPPSLNSLINLETEFKWTAADGKDFETFCSAAKKLSAVLTPFEKIKNTDLYLDSSSLDLKKQKTAVRIRQADGNFEFTLKQSNKFKKGLARRKEFTIPLGRIKNFKSALKKISGLKIFPCNIKPVFKIVNNRKYADLTFKNSKAQVCLDDIKIVLLETAKPKAVKMKEIELEFINGSPIDFKEFTRLVTKISGLKPAKISKVRTAYASVESNRKK